MKLSLIKLKALLIKSKGTPEPHSVRKTFPQIPYRESGKPGTASLSAGSGSGDIVYLRAMILAALLLLFLFVRLFFFEKNIGFYSLYILLCISLGYKLIKILFEWYHYWAISAPVAPFHHPDFTVDMFTTAMPGEPYDMIKSTLLAMVNVRYPHTSYLCDEGNSPELRALCNELGVIHVTRLQKIDAKAGNINNALRQATGDICVILDPDHAPLPQFLDEVLPYFNDPEIGFVQVPQMYKNAPDTWIAQSAAQQTYSFYGPLMMGMNSYGTVQAIGANCTFRRKALDSIGGHAAGLSEDMHTAMQLHAKGWKSVYKPVVITRGLVPANIEAYYKQQLKWSRGTFELLFTVFPRLFRHFSWRQRLHYFLLPLHFAAGIIVLIDIFIPIAALIRGEVPVYFNTNGLFWLFIPVICSVFLVRQYAQRWLMEKHERGFHFSGGILLFGTWWVYAVGFIYTLFRVKVPYIPTPKDNEKSNNLVLQIPGILVCLMAIAAIAVGLYRDWNPYNFVAAGFAASTVFMLGLVMLASQQLFLQKIKTGIRRRSMIRKQVQLLRSVKDNFLSYCYSLMRTNAGLLFSFSVLATFLLFAFVTKYDTIFSRRPAVTANTGGFYTGVYLPGADKKASFSAIDTFSRAINAPVNIISMYEAWAPGKASDLPQEQLDSITAKGSIPMITWEPWIDAFPANAQWPQLKKGKKGMAAIAAGVFDDYIRGYALKVKAFNHPIFIRFAQEPGNPAYPWSAAGDNTAPEYKQAWRHIVKIFADEAAANVTWVWNPWQPGNMMDYYPGDDYVDWTGLTCLNYGHASGDGQWHSFEDIYQPYRQQVLSIGKPVMLAEFGSTHYGGAAADWLAQAVDTIGKAYTEIRSIVFFNSNQDKNWITQWRPAPDTVNIDWTIAEPSKLVQPLRQYVKATIAYKSATVLTTMNNTGPQTVPNSIIKNSDGSFILAAAGKPFYIKGIVYNTNAAWQDGHLPLTMKQLQKDFAAMQAAGCNTISRSAPSVYDRNILRAAGQYGLKVIYGFWFDPSVDYFKDSGRVARYVNIVTDKVQQYKNSGAVLAWCIGSQTSTALNQQFSAPYLALVKHSYLQMIENIAQSIHRVDPVHPVITELENSLQLPSELQALRNTAPSVDITGINSFGSRGVEDIAAVVNRYNHGKPYLLTAFGPGHTADSSLDKWDFTDEGNDGYKSNFYSSYWKNNNPEKVVGSLGGLAFCWQDNFETTATSWGLTDFKGRKKPSYYALKKAWTGVDASPSIPSLFLVGPDYSLGPELYYTYTAVYDSSAFKKPEWRLLREDRIEETGTLLQADKINKITISVPDYGSYRLYVYLEDRKGNVTTSSIPVRALKVLL